MNTMALEPRVYIACLHCYNAGTLHGHWLDADDSLPDAVDEAFGIPREPVADDDDVDPNDAANRCPACGAGAGKCNPLTGEHVGRPGFAPCGGEEFVVHDYEGFGAYNPGECGVSEAAEIGQALRDADNGEALAAYCDHVGTAPQDLGRHDFSDAFAGEHKSIEDFAQDLAEQCDDIPDKWAPYIDWERYARDLELGGDVFTIDNPDGGVWVFWNR